MTTATNYPHAPGFKTTRTETSALAASQVAGRVGTLRRRVLDVLKHSDCTADEVATKLGESILAIRPRFSELNTLGLITPTPKRRSNASGKSAVVWTVHNPQQAELI